MKILILGGDGFCGWPTALRLSKSGSEITIIDNLSRRKIDKELKSNSITDIASIEDRISTAKQYGMDIKFLNIDITDYNALYHNVKTIKPDAIIHFAEQRAAPYSMISNKERRYTSCII